MNYLITGGCGFIGTNLIHALLRDGVESIKVVDDLSVGKREYLERMVGDNIEKVELVVGDICDRDLAQTASKDIDVVIHLAAQTGVIPSIENPWLDMKLNVIGTLNYLEAARKNGIKKFVFASSSAPLGEQKPPINEEKVPRPLSPYGAAKLAGEGYCSAYYSSFGVNTVALRFSNVYGPGSYHKGSVVAAFFKMVLKGEPLIIYGDGNQTRDFLYTDDISRAIMKASKSNVGGEVFQIASGTETTINDLASMIKEITKKDVSGPIKVIHEKERKGEIIRSYSDIEKAKRILGYTPEMPLENGLEKTWEWFKQHYKLKQDDRRIT